MSLLPHLKYLLHINKFICISDRHLRFDMPEENSWFFSLLTYLCSFSSLPQLSKWYHYTLSCSSQSFILVFFFCSISNSLILSPKHILNSFSLSSLLSIYLHFLSDFTVPWLTHYLRHCDNSNSYLQFHLLLWTSVLYIYTTV